MEIDFDPPKGSADFTAVPDGTYRCTVAEVRTGTTRSNEERWSLRLVVAEGPYTGKHAAWDSLVFSNRGLARARMVFRELGLPCTGKVHVQPKDIEGRLVYVQLVAQAYSSPDGFTVKRSEVPYSGYTSALKQPPDRPTMTLRETSENIRRLLKAAGIGRYNYSVTSERFAGGCSIRVRIDKACPIKRELAEAIRAHAYGSFDGMADSFNYSDHKVDCGGEQRHPGAKYVFLDASVEG